MTKEQKKLKVEIEEFLAKFREDLAPAIAPVQKGKAVIPKDFYSIIKVNLKQGGLPKMAEGKVSGTSFEKVIAIIKLLRIKGFDKEADKIAEEIKKYIT